MKTDQLINVLAADLEPVDRGRISKTLYAALWFGLVAAFGAMLLLLTPRHELFSGSNLQFLSIKMLFTLGVVVIAAMLLPRLARPGAETRGFFILASIPFVAMFVLTAVTLSFSDWPSWGGLIAIDGLRTCLVFVPLFAIVPFAAITWALRQGAPTARIHAGAFAGLAAAGLSAMACAFPCPDDSLLSIAVSYAPIIGFCAGIGARVGPLLLRW